jgi:hypothetical protein
MFCGIAARGYAREVSVAGCPRICRSVGIFSLHQRLAVEARPKVGIALSRSSRVPSLRDSAVALVGALLRRPGKTIARIESLACGFSFALGMPLQTMSSSTRLIAPHMQGRVIVQPMRDSKKRFGLFVLALIVALLIALFLLTRHREIHVYDGFESGELGSQWSTSRMLPNSFRAQSEIVRAWRRVAWRRRNYGASPGTDARKRATTATRLNEMS